MGNEGFSGDAIQATLAAGFDDVVDTRARAQSREVDAILWTPLSSLTHPGATGTVNVPLGNLDRQFPCFRVEGRVVWGLTYRILKGFFEILPPSISPPPTRP